MTKNAIVLYAFYQKLDPTGKGFLSVADTQDGEFTYQAWKNDFGETLFEMFLAASEME